MVTAFSPRVYPPGVTCHLELPVRQHRRSTRPRKAAQSCRWQGDITRALRPSRLAGQSDRCQHAALGGFHGLAYDAVAGFKLSSLDVALVRLVKDQVDVTVDVFGLHGAPDRDVLVQEAEIDGRCLHHYREWAVRDQRGRAAYSRKKFSRHSSVNARSEKPYESGS